MVMLIVDALLAGIVLLAVSLQKVYRKVPDKELKRRARSGDELAALLHRAVAYGLSLQVMLWLTIGLSAGGLFVLLSYTLPNWLAFLIDLIVVWLGFAWIPSGRVTKAGEYIARWCTPALAWILERLHPLLERVGLFFQRHRHVDIHTGLYQKDDLVELIQRQRIQTDNRMTHDELEIAEHALTFGDKLVRDVMIPRSQVKSVKANDTVGPVLMDELHESGHSRFPVYEGKQDNIIGTLYARDLLAADHGGPVNSVMRRDVFFVHEEDNLHQALQAFLKTKHHLFIVVNSFEEVIGVLTIEDILERIIGRPIVDEFDRYDDLRAVAAKQAEVEHQYREKQEAVKD